MTKINWETKKHITLGDKIIPIADDVSDGYNQGSGLKKDSSRTLLLKKIVWPFLKLRNDLFVDGFIEKEIGKLIKKHFKTDTVFLEVGCGDMSLRRFVPKNLYYNAFDLELSEFHLKRVNNEKNINPAIASSTSIPAKSNSASMIVSTETLEHIPEIKKAVEEIHRIATPGATLICSIPNNFCFKYAKKGPHPGHINNWTFDSFKNFMEGNNFSYVDGYMKGWWLPLPLWITRTSYQFPFSSKKEYYNTNFIYVFKAVK